LRECEKALARSGAQIVTVVGRYFAMDRDRRWDRRRRLGTQLFTARASRPRNRPLTLSPEKYREGKTDEFMPAMIFSHAGEERVRDDDVVLFFNFRAGSRAAAFAGVFVREFRWFRSRKVAASSFRNPYSI
jgi:2,3-bisphosphoglycerate-independent phosphoglycerate mutase